MPSKYCRQYRDTPRHVHRWPVSWFFLFSFSIFLVFQHSILRPVFIYRHVFFNQLPGSIDLKFSCPYMRDEPRWLCYRRSSQDLRRWYPSLNQHCTTINPLISLLVKIDLFLTAWKSNWPTYKPRRCGRIVGSWLYRRFKLKNCQVRLRTFNWVTLVYICKLNVPYLVTRIPNKQLQVMNSLF